MEALGPATAPAEKLLVPPTGVVLQGLALLALGGGPSHVGHEAEIADPGAEDVVSCGLQDGAEVSA